MTFPEQPPSPRDDGERCTDKADASQRPGAWSYDSTMSPERPAVNSALSSLPHAFRIVLADKARQGLFAKHSHARDEAETRDTNAVQRPGGRAEVRARYRRRQTLIGDFNTNVDEAESQTRKLAADILPALAGYVADRTSHADIVQDSFELAEAFMAECSDRADILQNTDIPIDELESLNQQLWPTKPPT